MPKIGLSFYSVKVLAPIKIKNKEEYKETPLNDVYGKNISDWIYEYLLAKAKGYQKDSEKEKIYRPNNVETSRYIVKEDYYFSSICGIVKSGDYGIEVEIVDSDTSEKVFDQKKEQAGVLPFGFALYFSDGISTGILVTQSYGAKGMSNHFKQIVKNSIEKNCDKHKVIIKNVFPDAYFRRLLDNEQVKDICVETYKKIQNSDKDDKVKDSEIVDYSAREIRFKNPVFKSINRIYDIFSQRHSLHEIKGLTNDDEEIHNIKLNFVVNGSPKTVNYDTYFSLRISEDITDDVLINENTGHPNSLSLFKQMDEYVLMYLINMQVVSEINDNYDLEKIWDRHFHIKINEDKTEEVVDKCNERVVITV